MSSTIEEDGSISVTRSTSWASSDTFFTPSSRDGSTDSGGVTAVPLGNGQLGTDGSFEASVSETLLSRLRDDRVNQQYVGYPRGHDAFNISHRDVSATGDFWLLKKLRKLTHTGNSDSRNLVSTLEDLTGFAINLSEQVTSLQWMVEGLNTELRRLETEKAAVAPNEEASGTKVTNDLADLASRMDKLEAANGGAKLNETVNELVKKCKGYVQLVKTVAELYQEQRRMQDDMHAVNCSVSEYTQAQSTKTSKADQCSAVVDALAKEHSSTKNDVEAINVRVDELISAHTVNITHTKTVDLNGTIAALAIRVSTLEAVHEEDFDFAEQEEMRVTCGGEGHEAWECMRGDGNDVEDDTSGKSERAAADLLFPSPVDGSTCANCGETDHSLLYCSYTEPVTCHNCGKQGHKARRCSYKPPVTSGQLSEDARQCDEEQAVKCGSCGGIGPGACKCTYYWCYRCGEDYHQARDCPRFARSGGW